MLQFSLEDFDRRALAIQGPQDIDLVLSRTPSLRFETDGRVDAIPTPIGPRTDGEYLVCDRNGHLARIGWGSAERWTQSVKTLSGVARRPLPLPSREKRMLFVTETGAVWLVGTEDGHLEGPWELGEPPALGPIVVGGEIHAQLRGAELARWSTSLRPTIEPAGQTPTLEATLRSGDAGLFTALRPDGSHDPVLGARASHGSDWSVRVGETHYEVSSTGEDARSLDRSRRGVELPRVGGARGRRRGPRAVDLRRGRPARLSPPGSRRAVTSPDGDGTDDGRWAAGSPRTIRGHGRPHRSSPPHRWPRPAAGPDGSHTAWAADDPRPGRDRRRMAKVSSAGFARAAEGERARWRELITGRDEARPPRGVPWTWIPAPRPAPRSSSDWLRDLPDESEERRVIRAPSWPGSAHGSHRPAEARTGVDLVAARVLGELLARDTTSDGALELLVELACGRPHPDLAARVRLRRGRPPPQGVTAAWCRSCSPSCAPRLPLKPSARAPGRASRRSRG